MVAVRLKLFIRSDVPPLPIWKEKKGDAQTEEKREQWFLFN